MKTLNFTLSETPSVPRVGECETGGGENSAASGCRALGNPAPAVAPNGQPCALRLLRLTLTRHWFNLVASGEKKEEYRVASDWILSRLIGKRYDRVQFRNGYAATAPMVECEFLGYECGFGRKEWGAGSSLCIIIKLGAITALHNAPAQPIRPATGTTEGTK